MICSIKLTDCYTIGSNSNNKISVDGHTLSMDNEIPFVRYEFSNWTDREFTYIKQSIAKFNKSTHLAEVTLADDTAEVVAKLKENKMAVFVYTDITNDEVAVKQLNETKMALIQKLVASGVEIDRFAIKDRSSTLDAVAANAIIKVLGGLFNKKADFFGICSSPLCFDGNWACLTAVRARELMSKYSTIADVALPSANHQNMNDCGCIKYLTVNQDCLAPADSAAKGKKKSAESSGDKPEKAKADKADKPKTDKPKAVKNVLTPGAFNL